MLLSTSMQAGGIARRVIQKAGGEPTALLHALDAFIGRQPKVSGGNTRQVRSSGTSASRSFLANMPGPLMPR